MVEAETCHVCGTLLQLTEAVRIVEGRTCSCPTGSCSCRRTAVLHCPRCEPRKGLVYIWERAPEQKEPRERLKDLFSGSPWLGDKKSRQRDRSRWSARGSIKATKKGRKP